MKFTNTVSIKNFCNFFELDLHNSIRNVLNRIFVLVLSNFSYTVYSAQPIVPIDPHPVSVLKPFHNKPLTKSYQNHITIIEKPIFPLDINRSHHSHMSFIITLAMVISRLNNFISNYMNLSIFMFLKFQSLLLTALSR